MSQVFIEFTQVAPSTEVRNSPVSSYLADVVEITSGAGDQDTGAVVTKFSPKENIVTVINNGTDTIWVNFGAAATAATPSRPVAPNTARDFGGVKKGVAIHVINDS